MASILNENLSVDFVVGYELIAERQSLAVTTIKTHVSNTLAKLNVDNRGKAADWFHHNHG